MAHLARDSKKLQQRIRRIRGQVEAIERSLAEQRTCEEVLNLIAAVRGATASLMAEVVEEHIRFHVLDPDGGSAEDRRRAAEQLIDVLKTYLK